MGFCYDIRVRTRAFRYRIYPSPEQEQRLLEWAGASRFVYNIALEQRRDWWRQFRTATGRLISLASQSRELTEMRAASGWLSDAPRSAQDYALRDVDLAFRAFFRLGGFPRFRSKDEHVAFRVKGSECHLSAVNRKWATLSLSKGLIVKLRLSRSATGRILSVAVKKTAVGWFACVATESEQAPRAICYGAVGIDRGVSQSLCLSTGATKNLPTYVSRLNSQRMAAQRVLSRRKRGSRRSAHAKASASRLFAKSADARRHWLHEQSTDIAKRFGQVAIEKLNTANMTRAGCGKRGLNRAILEQGWAMFAQMLEYKLADRGGVLHYVNPAYTSQTCSSCGSVNAESRKSQAVFECVDCGHRANADVNAAINILRRSPAGVEGAGYGPVEARTGEMLTHLENLAA